MILEAEKLYYMEIPDQWDHPIMVFGIIRSDVHFVIERTSTGGRSLILVPTKIVEDDDSLILDTEDQGKISLYRLTKERYKKLKEVGGPLVDSRSWKDIQETGIAGIKP